MDKLVKHSETNWSLFYDLPRLNRHCVNMVVKDNKVVDIMCVWVLTGDGYDDGVIVDLDNYFKNYHEFINKKLEELL